MDFTLYKLSEIEIYINKIYKDNGIFYPEDMDIERIADIFGIEVHYYDGRPFADWKENEYSYVILNAFMALDQKRAAFFHEVCHPLKHIGQQRNMPSSFKELQETQANLFQLYASMPFYMIEEYTKDVYSWTAFEKNLAEAFCLPLSLVKRRIEQIKNRIYWAQIDQERNKKTYVKITDEHVRNVIAELIRKQENRRGAVV